VLIDPLRRESTIPDLATSYGPRRLVRSESDKSMDHAILREQQREAESRANNLALITGLDPNRRDLYEDIL
jgi:predicted GIY-YIG superfamily endonuclease